MGDVELIKFRRRSGDQRSPPRGLQQRCVGDHKPAQTAVQRKCSCRGKKLCWLAVALVTVLAIGLAVLLGHIFGDGGTASNKPTRSVKTTSWSQPVLSMTRALTNVSASATLNGPRTHFSQPKADYEVTTTNVNKSSPMPSHSESDIDRSSMSTVTRQPGYPLRMRPPRASKWIKHLLVAQITNLVKCKNKLGSALRWSGHPFFFNPWMQLVLFDSEITTLFFVTLQANYFHRFFFHLFLAEWLKHTHYCLTGAGPGRKGELTLSLPAPPRGTALLVYRLRRNRNVLVKRLTESFRDAAFDSFRQVRSGVNILSYRLKLQNLETNTTSKRFSRFLRIKFTNDQVPKCGYKDFVWEIAAFFNLLGLVFGISCIVLGFAFLPFSFSLLGKSCICVQVY